MSPAPLITAPTLQARIGLWWNSNVQWIDDHWADIAIAVAAGLILYAMLSGLRGFALRRAKAASGELTLTELIGRVMHKTSSLVLAIVATRIVAGYASPPALLMTIINFAFTVAATLQVAIWAREILLGIVQRRAADGQHETLVNAMGIIRLLISVALFAVAVVVILDNIGVNVTALIAGLGIGGIAIGLAAQGIFSDLFAALSIIFDRPFRNGETIKWDNTTATVERVGLKSTRLRSVNGELLIVSNTNLLNKEIANFAHLKRRRIQFAIGVIYQTTPPMLRDLPALMEAQVQDAGHEFVRAGFTAFGASSLDFELVFDVYSDDTDDVAAARTDVAIRLFEAMTTQGYDFAYPTQTSFTAAPDGRMILPYAEDGEPAPKPTPARKER